MEHERLDGIEAIKSHVAVNEAAKKKEINDEALNG